MNLLSLEFVHTCSKYLPFLEQQDYQLFTIANHDISSCDIWNFTNGIKPVDLAMND